MSGLKKAKPVKCACAECGKAGFFHPEKEVEPFGWLVYRLTPQVGAAERVKLFCEFDCFMTFLAKSEGVLEKGGL